MTISVTKIELEHPKYGTWIYDGKSKFIGGKPFPSEAEAHRFEKVAIPLIEAEIAKILSAVFKVKY